MQESSALEESSLKKSNFNGIITKNSHIVKVIRAIRFGKYCNEIETITIRFLKIKHCAGLI